MQTINFYFDEYRPKPLSFDTKFAALLLATVTIALLFFGFFQSQQVKQLNQLLLQKKASVTKSQSDLIELQKKLKVDESIIEIDEIIRKKQSTLNSYRKILAQVGISQQEQFTYSEILQQLADHPSDSVWLTQISINLQQLSLYGSALEPKSVPDYIEQLNSGKALTRQFDKLEVVRDQQNDRFVNFSLLNGKVSHAR